VSAQNWDAELYESKHSFVWQYGEGLVDLLAPKPGERILDIGCGTGHLTRKIADSGASVVGIDSAVAMIGQARQNYPQLTFALADCTQMEYSDEFDAVFSNAALHWVLDAAAAVKAMARALRSGGRLIVEFGGHGNVQIIENAVIAAVAKHLGNEVPPRKTYYPSIAAYTSLLEAHGIETQWAQLYQRPTPLEGAHGMENWIRQFKWYYFEALTVEFRAGALKEVLADLGTKLHNAQGWYADYRRLRIIAFKR
jgi:trans-aconitate 2-methyltransferase